MARICPLDGEPALYLGCLECDERRQCRAPRPQRRDGTGKETAGTDAWRENAERGRQCRE